MFTRSRGNFLFSPSRDSLILFQPRATARAARVARSRAVPATLSLAHSPPNHPGEGASETGDLPELTRPFETVFDKGT